MLSVTKEKMTLLEFEHQTFYFDIMLNHQTQKLILMVTVQLYEYL